MRIFIIVAVIAVFAALAASCSNKQKKVDTVDTNYPTVAVEKTESLVIYTPNYSRIDLVCGTMPKPSEKDVILVCEAAFTGELLKEFKHSNIATDHVSSGVRYDGYKCKRNTGAFTWSPKQKGEFTYKNYSSKFDEAAKEGGMGFGQEMLIHKGKIVPYTRSYTNVNEFRALCLYKGKICVIDGNGKMQFGKFIESLRDLGVDEALYLDMGTGWNYSWYRPTADSAPIYIHNKDNRYNTNWITFYK